jgi:hypothetical protein
MGTNRVRFSMFAVPVVVAAIGVTLGGLALGVHAAPTPRATDHAA